MWCEVLPTRGAKMLATCLEMLQVTKLMLLTMGLRGAPSLCTDEGIELGHWLLLFVAFVSILLPFFCKCRMGLVSELLILITLHVFLM